jgi:hypothetical protein
MTSPGRRPARSSAGMLTSGRTTKPVDAAAGLPRRQAER